MDFAADSSDMSYIGEMWVALTAAVAAAVLALLGNAAIQHLRSRDRVREELREFVRSLHADTVATVADLDLFIRDLSMAVLTGEQRPGAELSVRDEVQEGWDRGLLRRLRQLRFGHPDPDVRESAEVMEDEMWPFVTAAKAPDDRVFPPPLTDEHRQEAYDNARVALVRLRAAVWTAPRRDVPKGNYDGLDLPSRLSRALERQRDEAAS